MPTVYLYSVFLMIYVINIPVISIWNPLRGYIQHCAYSRVVFAIHHPHFFSVSWQNQHALRDGYKGWCRLFLGTDMEIWVGRRSWYHQLMHNLRRKKIALACGWGRECVIRYTFLFSQSSHFGIQNSLSWFKGILTKFWTIYLSIFSNGYEEELIKVWGKASWW